MFRWPLLLVLAFPIVASAQMVRGTVTDATSGLPIKAANLSLYTSEGQRILRGVSDDGGKFEMVLPKGKTVFLQAERIGYQTIKSANITASTSELLELNVRLSAVAVQLQGIEVSARRQADPRLQPFLDRALLYKRSGFGHIWTRKELEKYPLAMVSHLLRRVPMRPAIACSGLVVFIDDMPVEAEDVDLLVAKEDLEGAEIYRDSEIPPDLLVKTWGLSMRDPTFPPCLTMMLWRKPYGELHPEYGPHRAKLWRVLAGAGALVALLLAERDLMGK